jgi:hypothetical protein
MKMEKASRKNVAANATVGKRRTGRPTARSQRDQRSRHAGRVPRALKSQDALSELLWELTKHSGENPADRRDDVDASTLRETMRVSRKRSA